MLTGRVRRCTVFASIVVAGLGLSRGAFADEHLRGVISDHPTNGTVVLQTDESKITVVMDDATKVRRTDGLRVRKVSSALLVPGLRIEVSGEFQAGNRFHAERIEFARSDLKTAQAISGGLNPTDQRSLRNQQRIEANERLLAQQKQTLDRQAQDIASNREQISANQQKIVATTGALEATNARIGSLDDYDVIDSVTVYFRNGSARISPKYKSALEQMASKAKSTRYVVQVQGYASAVGPLELNQKLSMQRADAVTSVLQQNGVPLTKIVVPAAMGINDQVSSNKTAKGQADNRRTVVTLLQNKGTAKQ